MHINIDENGPMTCVQWKQVDRPIYRYYKHIVITQLAFKNNAFRNSKIWYLFNTEWNTGKKRETLMSR